jgi:hypothetical protein
MIEGIVSGHAAVSGARADPESWDFDQNARQSVHLSLPLFPTVSVATINLFLREPICR